MKFINTPDFGVCADGGDVDDLPRPLNHFALYSTTTQHCREQIVYIYFSFQESEEQKKKKLHIIYTSTTTYNIYTYMRVYNIWVGLIMTFVAQQMRI